MPQSLSKFCAYGAALCAWALCVPVPIAAQGVSDAASTADPRSLLLATAATNGAPGVDSKPWHMKISFTLNDWDGKPESQGTLEEFWAAPDKFKLVYATSLFNQVEYTTPSGIRRTGIRDAAPPEFANVIGQFLHPLVINQDSIETLKLKERSQTLGKTKLVCIAATTEKQSSAEPGLNSTYCMDDTAPILRLVYSPGGWQTTIRNTIVKFQDRYLPRTVERLWPSHYPDDHTTHLELAAKLEILEILKSVDEAQFTPPADAMNPPQVINLDEKTTRAQIQQHASPAYPPIAKAAQVSGDVVISLQIQTDGRVSHLRVLSGPPMLQQAAIDAVKRWTYKPFENNGDLVEVNTTITVPFRLWP